MIEIDPDSTKRKCYTYTCRNTTDLQIFREGFLAGEKAAEKKSSQSQEQRS